MPDHELIHFPKDRWVPEGPISTATETELSQLGTQTYDAAEMVSCMADEDLAGDLLGMHGDLNTFVMLAAESCDQTLLREHVTSLRDEIQDLVDGHIRVIVELQNRTVE